MGCRIFSLALTVFCTFAVTIAAQAQVYGTLPVKNIPIVRQPPKVPHLPNFPLFPPGSLPWNGGVTVGGGLLAPTSVCEKLQSEVFDRNQVEKARSEGFDVSLVNGEFFQAMVDVARVLEDLQKRSAEGRLRERHLALIATIERKMSSVPAEALDRLVGSCGEQRSSFLFLVYSSKQVDHIQNAVDYLMYFGNWRVN